MNVLPRNASVLSQELLEQLEWTQNMLEVQLRAVEGAQAQIQHLNAVILVLAAENEQLRK